MTLVTLPNRPVAGDPEDISKIMADFDAVLAVLNGDIRNDNIAVGAAIAKAKLDFGTGLTDADISPTAAIQLSKLASIPGGVTVGNKIADLGAGAAGKLGLLRLMPSTYNAGGATALPAATITVGDTTDLPTAGSATTPNGTISWTGKTATTLTGSSGGTGTLAANAAITLLTGTPPSGSYEEVLVIYDAVVNKWISIDTYRHTMRDNNQWSVTPGALNTWTEIPAPTGSQADSIPVIKWRARDAAGLKPQVRHGGGSVWSTNAGNTQYRPSFRSIANRAGLGTYVNIGADANAASEVAANGASVSDAFGGTPWGSIPAYTLADLFAPGIQVQQTSGAVGSQKIAGVLEVRWVG